MVQRHHRRRLRSSGECFIEPTSVLFVERAARHAFDGAVQRDDAHREVFDRIGKLARARQIGVRGKGRTQQAAIIVVARN